MIYKAQFILQKSGYKKRRLEGVCQFPDDCEKSVTEMKRDATEFVRNKLIERNPVFEKFTIDDPFQEVKNRLYVLPSPLKVCK